MIRPMRRADAEAAAALVRHAFGAIRTRLDPVPSGGRLSAAAVDAQLDAAGGGGAVWDEDGPRGCVLWKAVEGGLYLGRLAVAPGWQGRGIGRALIGAAEAEARRRGVGRLVLEVRLALDGNRRLFAACGFREGALRSHPGFAVPTFVEAVKELG